MAGRRWRSQRSDSDPRQHRRMRGAHVVMPNSNYPYRPAVLISGAGGSRSLASEAFVSTIGQTASIGNGGTGDGAVCSRQHALIHRRRRNCDRRYRGTGSLFRRPGRAALPASIDPRARRDRDAFPPNICAIPSAASSWFHSSIPSGDAVSVRKLVTFGSQALRSASPGKSEGGKKL